MGYGQRSEVPGISPLVHRAIAGFGLAVAALVMLRTGPRALARGRCASGPTGRRPAVMQPRTGAFPEHRDTDAAPAPGPQHSNSWNKLSRNSNFLEFMMP